MIASFLKSIEIARREEQLRICDAYLVFVIW